MARQTFKLLSLVIPVYNEEDTIAAITNKVLSTSLPDYFSLELIYVNDGSKDRSVELIEKIIKDNPDRKITLLNNEKNLGKTQTVKKGILASKGDYVMIQDADLEYDPDEYQEMLDPLASGKIDVVYGNRFGKKNKVIYYQNYFGNRLLSMFSNIFTYPRIGTMIPDMEVCYKLVRGDVIREVAQDITATSNFGFEPEITAKLSKYKLNGKHLRFAVVPISYHPRSMEEGKKMHAFKDGFKALIEIIKYNL